MLRQALFGLAALFAIFVALAATTMSASAAEAEDVSVTEGDSGSQTVQVEVTGPFTPGSNLNYNLLAGTATYEVDFTGPTVGVISRPSDGSACESLFVPVTIVGDEDVEPNETIWLYSLDIISGLTTITIVNDDFPDATAPVVTVPGAITVDASSSSGAVVTFSVSATDDVDGPITPVCDYQSGATFPIGTTTVNCTATDAADNTGNASFDIVVLSAVPPALSLPGDIIVDATGPAGAEVTFSATATDNVDGPITPVCTPPSGSVFPSGTTVVSCTATDSADNVASGAFTVTVLFPDLVVDKAAAATEIRSGEDVSYAITVSNLGPGDAFDVTLTDLLPPGIAWIADPGAGSCSIAGGILTCNLGTIASGSSVAVAVSGATDSNNCGVLSNTASVTASNEADGDLGNNSASAADITVLCQAGGDGGSISIGSDNTQDNDNDSDQDANQGTGQDVNQTGSSDNEQSGGDATNANESDQGNTSSDIDASGASGGDGGDGGDTDVGGASDGRSVNVGGDQGITATLIATLIALLMSLLL